MNATTILAIARWSVGLAASYTVGRALDGLVNPRKNLLAKAAVFVGSMAISSAVSRVVEDEFSNIVAVAKKEIAYARTS